MREKVLHGIEEPYATLIGYELECLVSVSRRRLETAKAVKRPVLHNSSGIIVPRSSSDE